jgi:hypothetical protein
MRTVRVLVAAALSALAMPVPAQNVPQSDEERLQIARQQAEEQKRIERARQTCIANRGVDCDTPQGLQEWLMLERTRAEAVLDRLLPRPEQPQPAPR